MAQLDRLPLERHLAGGVGASRTHTVEIETRRRVELEEAVNVRFTPGEGTFKQLLNRRLTPQQASAIDLMVEGACDAEVARVMGVNRSTISRWRQFHPGFVAELNRRRDSTLDAAADRLRRTTRHALDIIDQRLAAVDRPDLQLRAAVCLLRMIGVGGRAANVGATSAEQIIDEHAMVNRQHNRAFIDHGEREEVLLDLARKDEGARVDEESA